MLIARRWDGGDYFDGYMPEITVFASTLTNAQRNTIEANQSAYYSVPLVTPPTITGLSPAATICSGLSSTFSVTAVGGSLSYQWYKNGSSISGQSFSTLTLTGALTTSSGTLFAVVSNTAGTVTSSGISLSVACNTQNAISFNGSQATQPISIPALSTTNPAFTMEAWVYPGNGGSIKYTPFCFSNIGGNTGKFFVQLVDFSGVSPNMNIEAYYYNGSGTNVSSIVPRNTWSHIAVSADPVSGDLRLFLNGSLISSANVVQSIDYTSGAAVKMGEQVPGGENMTGYVDELRVWQGTRSNSQIAANFATTLPSTTPGLLVNSTFDYEPSSIAFINKSTGSAYNLNGAVYVPNYTFTGVPTSITGLSSNATVCSGSNLNLTVTAVGTTLNYQWYKNSISLSGQTLSTLSLAGINATSSGNYFVVVNGYNGTVTSSGIILTVSTCNNALNFDGIDDVVSIPYNSGFDFTNKFTIETWVNTTATTEQYLCLKTEDSWFLSINSVPNKASIWIYGLNSGWFSSTSNVNDGNWHHIAVTYDGAFRKLYFDGVLENSQVDAGNFTAGTSPVVLGKRGGFNFFKGYMDELRLWNIAQSQTSLRNNIVNGITGNEAGLVAYYNFNSGNPNANNAGVTSLNNGSTISGINGQLNSFGLNGNSSNWIASPAPILGNPTITGLSTAQTVCPGSTTTMTVGAIGMGLIYQWLKNGSPIAGQTFSTLTLSGSLTTTPGTFSVVVQSLGGSQTSTGIALSLLSSTGITSQPISATICGGNTKVFSVIATGSGLNYVW
ncbi:MAG: hypothetical protein K2Q22_15480, partial [Cytophagales bacterium]|nr:hypothetical protein [Cytophagales bacterium]